MISWLLWVIARASCRLILVLLGGVRAEGLDNVPPTGPVLVCPNHLSHLDPPAVGVALRRRAWYMATDELFAIRGLGTLARLLRAFPVHQDSPDRTALRKAEEVLRRGDALVVFPEGHESRSGVLQPLQPGVLLLAVRSGAPVVPVGIVGTDAMMAPAGFRVRRASRPARLSFGRPIPVVELTDGLRGRAGIDRGADRLQDEIAAILERMTGAPYPRAERVQLAGPVDKGGFEGV